MEDQLQAQTVFFYCPMLNAHDRHHIFFQPSLSGSLMRSQNQTVTLKWALWLPFEGGSPEEKEMTLELTGGCEGFPSDRLVYAKKLPQPSGKKVWISF